MILNIYFVYAIVFILALISARFISVKLLKFSARNACWLVGFMMGITALTYAVLSCWRYEHLIYGLWDFGANDAMIHNMACFKSFLRSYDNGYSEHFLPLLVLFVPFYWIWDSPSTALILQAILMSAAGIPLYLLGKAKLQKSWMAFLLVAMYLLNPYFSRYTLYEFHVGCLFPIFYFFAVLAWEKQQKWLFLLLMFLIPMIKESFIAVLIGHGLFLLSCRQQRSFGLIILGMAVFWTFFVTKIWYPHIIPLEYHHTDRYPAMFAGSLFQTGKNLLLMVTGAFNINSIAVGVSVFGAFAFLCLFSWRATILLCGPVLMCHFCSVNQHQQMLMSHYSDIVIAPVTIAALYGMAVLTRYHIKGRGYYFRFCGAMAVLMHIFFCDLPFVKYHNYIQRFNTARQFGILSIPLSTTWFNYKHPEIFKEIVPLIPRNTIIVAQNNLGCDFVRDYKVFQIPGPVNPDFYLFDMKSGFGFDSTRNIDSLLSRLAADTAYVCLFNYDGYLVFCRKEFLMQPGFKDGWIVLCRKYPLVGGAGTE